MDGHEVLCLPVTFVAFYPHCLYRFALLFIPTVVIDSCRFLPHYLFDNSLQVTAVLHNPLRLGESVTAWTPPVREG